MKLLLSVWMILCLTSCIKESLPECPYQYNIRIFVKDKNYSNSSAIGVGIVDENLPFKQYVSNIYYTLKNITTGEDIISPVLINVAGEEKEIELIFDKIPDGDYLLTVWGNIEPSGNSVEDPSFLHENKTEDTDEYIATEVLSFRTGLAQAKSIGLERIKGKLIVTLENIPDAMNEIKETVSSIYQMINNQRIYSQTTDVEKVVSESNQPLNNISTFLAPSVGSGNSMLSLMFYELGNNIPVLEVDPIQIDIKRNEIAAVNVNYNSAQNRLEIWVYIDNKWTLVQWLDIQ